MLYISPGRWCLQPSSLPGSGVPFWTCNIHIYIYIYILRHYQIEFFPVFGDRRFCGWNLVCRWEYSICLRWVAKCWFRVYIYVYIYIYIRNRWYFELINYGNISPNLHDFKLNYSICWIRVYIYIYIYMKNEHQQFQQFHISMFIKEGNITGILIYIYITKYVHYIYIYIYIKSSWNR